MREFLVLAGSIQILAETVEIGQEDFRPAKRATKGYDGVGA